MFISHTFLNTSLSGEIKFNKLIEKRKRNKTKQNKTDLPIKNSKKFLEN